MNFYIIKQLLNSLLLLNPYINKYQLFQKYYNIEIRQDYLMIKYLKLIYT